ncbi:MAG: hypothetical protein ACPG1C_03990 [Alphaproteobacteria bacterium]
MKSHTKMIGTAIVGIGVAVSAIAVSSAALANGYLEERPWQFDTSYDKFVKGSLLDLRERRKAGAFKFESNTYIDKQFNCALTSSTVGNVSDPLNEGQGHAPGVSDSEIWADASGAAADNITDTVGSVSTSTGNSTTGGSIGDGNGNDNTGGGADSSGTASGNTASGTQSAIASNQDQTLTDSPTTATAEGNSIDGSNSGTITGDVLNSIETDQDNTNSTLTASVMDSSACAYTDGAP